MYYTHIEIENGQQITQIIQKRKDGSMLAFRTDPANTDYQEYLKWLAEGNEPLPADAQPE